MPVPPPSPAERLALGTVQMGVPYGIANPHGQVPAQEALAILELADRSGVDTLDTAQGYGESEAIIGRFLRAQPHARFRIVSKFGPPEGSRTLAALLQQTLQSLGVAGVYGFLVHDFDWLRQNPRFWEELRRLRSRGGVEKVGFSVYRPGQLEWSLAQGWDFDLVQLPFNVFDRRFEGLLPELKARGIEVHSRSAFLQGLFFRDPELLPSHFDGVREKLRGLREWARRENHALPAVLLRFCLSRAEIDRVVIGVDSRLHFEENLAVLGEPTPPPGPETDLLEGLVETNEEVLLPFRWRLSEAP